MPGSLRTVETVVYSQQSVDQFEILRLSESCEFVAPYYTVDYSTVDTSTVRVPFVRTTLAIGSRATDTIHVGSVRS